MRALLIESHAHVNLAQRRLASTAPGIALGAIREILFFLRRCCRQRFRKESEEVRGVPITLAGLVGKWMKFSSGGVSELCEGIPIYPIHMLQIQEHTFTEQNTELTRSSCLRTSSTSLPAFWNRKTVCWSVLTLTCAMIIRQSLYVCVCGLYNGNASTYC